MADKRYYAGIGSRDIPREIADIMEELGFYLSREGYTLRSGASPGADTAFELGVVRAEGEFEIYLPWEGFAKRKGRGFIDSTTLNTYKKARRIAEKYYLESRDFSSLSEKSQKLIIRDTYQVMGSDLKTLSNFVVCWTEDACINTSRRSEKTGGTGQAISIAADLEIPIFNLRIKPHREKILKWINSFK